MASWQDLEQGAPGIARPGRARLDQARVVLLGTLRRDGSPRISPVEPHFVHLSWAVRRLTPTQAKYIKLFYGAETLHHLEELEHRHQHQVH